MPQHNTQWLKENLTSGNCNSAQGHSGIFPRSKRWLGEEGEKEGKRQHFRLYESLKVKIFAYFPRIW